MTHKLQIARFELTTYYLSNNCYNLLAIFAKRKTKAEIDRFELSFTILKIVVLTVKLYFRPYYYKTFSKNKK